MKENNKTIRPIYFEKQSNDRLCGVHCLNALLQAPMFDPIILSEIGLRLDEMEKQLYSSNSQRINENVDDDGNYNVQVLSQALKNCNAEIEAMKSADASRLLENNMDQIEAFIFNSSTHWFAIRKIDNVWYNLNSTNAYPGPEIISDFFLSAFIQGTEDIGYTNFLVRNIPPLSDSKSTIYQNLQPHQRLVPQEDIIKAKNSKKIKQQGDNKDNVEEDKNKFKAFTGKGVMMSDTKVQERKDFEDDEMNQAYELSLQEYIWDLEKYLPKEPVADGYSITVRINDLSCTRMWNGTDKINDIINFVKTKVRTFNEVQLFEAFPRRVFDDPTLSISEAKLLKNQILMGKLI